MEKILPKIRALLLKGGYTVAIAESCTGGLVSGLLTQLPGSSQYFLCGVVAYSNNSKNRLLKVPLALLKEKGAVSGEVARAMAENIKKISGADLGIGVTGIAGPGGAIPGKPVGTVFICLTQKNVTTCIKYRFRGNRSQIRNQSAFEALKMLYNLLVSAV